MIHSLRRCFPVGILCLLFTTSLATGAEPPVLERLASEYPAKIVPLVRKYCIECHSADLAEAEIDLTAYAAFADVSQHPEVWQKVGEMLTSGQMPPKDAAQPSDADRAEMSRWVGTYLKEEARRNAGDPGPTILRRLSNAEYTYSLRDLTGIATLDPAQEFPVDGAAGEGFTNAAQALVMSPSLLTKYLDAGKEVAAHAVLLPRGLRFSPATTRRDWTNEILAEIRELYARYAASEGATQVNLQGIVFDTNGGGRLPLDRYFAALLEERDALRSQKKTLATLASERQLSPKYLKSLWNLLEATPDNQSPSLLLDSLRALWRAPDVDATKLVTFVSPWQQALWKFSSVGHIGKVGGPKAWMETVDPVLERQEIRQKLEVPADAKEITVYLVSSDASDGNTGDYVVWERPRLVAPGRQDLPLRDVRRVMSELAERRQQLSSSTAQALAAAAEAQSAKGPVEVARLAAAHSVDPDVLAAWLGYFGLTSDQPARIGPLVNRPSKGISGYEFVQGWVGDDALSIVASSSDEHVRIPGNLAPHSVAVHPSPSLGVVIAWQSPIAGNLQIEGAVQHAHPECGNGVTWKLELRRGNSRQVLAQGIAHGPNRNTVGLIPEVPIQTNDFVTLVISPRDGNHSCDLTAVDLTLKGEGKEWNLARDVSGDILAGNPHADRYSNKEAWRFASEPADRSEGHIIPSGSLAARWQASRNPDERQQLARQIQQLLMDGPADLAADAPDRQLYQQLTTPAGPLVATLLDAVTRQTPKKAETTDSTIGIDPQLFGKHPNGSPVDPESLCVQAPSILEIRLPADLANGAEIVTSAALHPETAAEGSVQCQLSLIKPETSGGLTPAGTKESTAGGAWTSNNQRISYATPILVKPDSIAFERMERSFAEFRQWFPAALCYAKIVPVDEVITLTLFHREDEPLSRLLLNDEEAADLDELWDELRFVSQDSLTLVDAFEQLLQFASQDADPSVFEPMRKPIMDRAASFRQTLADAQPYHVDAVIAIAGKAYRRPLTTAEAEELKGLYATFRKEEIPHDDAIRLMLARVFVSPAFLYRPEQALTAEQAKVPAQSAEADFPSHPITDDELATRLSYFLTASLPDEELRSIAASKRLHTDEGLLAQTRRLLRDEKIRRLSVEFGCQWLHIYDFDRHDEKSEQTFPTFASLRGPMYEESIRFLTNLFQTNGSLLDVLDADYTFVNAPLAEHYGIGNVASDWQKVEGLKAKGRGGILGMASTLAKQSGASRTSPILRGNWVCEVLLGDKLPKPPKNVPLLPDTVPAGLTERQLIEQHSSVESCAKCHARIDPLGFTLERFDAIGRWREETAERKFDVRGKLLDGSEIEGLDGLRNYLLNTRRDDFVRQFCKKLLGYALGRGVLLSDEPLLEAMQRQLKTHDYRVGVAVETIVLSPQFRNIRTAAPAENALDQRHNEPLQSKRTSVALE